MKKILAIIGPMVVTAAAGWLAKRRQARKQDHLYADTAAPARS